MFVALGFAGLQHGPKAAHLARAAQAGFAVPAGIVIPRT